MRALSVIVVVAATACTSGGENSSAPAPTPEPTRAVSPPDSIDAASAAPEKPTAFANRLLLAKEIAIPDLRRKVEAAAVAVKLTYEKGDPKSKCRRVSYLDAGGVLRAHGLALRVRKKLDRKCVLETNRLAMSFNLRSGDLARAYRARDELAPSEQVDAKRTHVRYRLDTSIGPKVYTPRYVAGGTVRGLNAQPKTLDDLRAIYPKLPLSDKGELVAASTFVERNYDFGSVSNGSVRMPIEVAVWSTDAGHVVTEISYEYDDADGAGAMATNFARALKTELEGAIHAAEWREDIAYGSSASTGASPGSPP